MKRFFVKILVFSLFILASIQVFSQSRKELEQKKQKTLEEIEYTNQLMKNTQNSEKENLTSYYILHKKIKSQKQLIYQINEELDICTKQIHNYEIVINYMTEDLNYLKESYAYLILNVWKNREKQNALLFILSSRNFNQAYLRLRYIHELAEIRKKQLITISSIKSLLEVSKARLEDQVLLKEKLLNEKNTAGEILQNQQIEKEETIKSLQKQSKELKKELEKKQKQIKEFTQKIEAIIAEEIRKAAEEEARRKEEEARRKRNSPGQKTNTKTVTPVEKTLSTNFTNNYGNLPWPVENGIITSNYGTHPHPSLKNVTVENKGIDILSLPGSKARAIFEGTVSKVFSLPSMHNVILINHGDYYTVYANLETVTVKVGDKVSTKQIIGTIFIDKTDNKSTLHFELWKGKTTQNPNLWLAK